MFIVDAGANVGDFDRRRFFHVLRDNNMLFVSIWISELLVLVQIR